ncbi:hypothetical protein H0H92_005425 [Tricholoma furcatifolium]|nr:hypothetical protein H0H92_005425 [Tricholoma furcatifolium]
MSSPIPSPAPRILSAMSYYPATGPHPTSRYEAEIQWEVAREKLRLRVEYLGSSSFERTKYDVDEEFYSYFPLARRSAADEWIIHEFPQEPWAYSTPAIDFHIPAPARSLDFSKFSLAQALTLPSTTLPPPPPKKPSPLSLHFDYDFPQISSEPDEREQLLISTGLWESSAVPTQVHTAQRRSISAKTSRRQEYVYPPQSQLSPSSPMPTSTVPSSATTESAGTLFYLPQFTGNWEDDAIAAEEFRTRAMNNPNIPRPLVTRPALPKLALPKVNISVSRSKSDISDHPYARQRRPRHHPYSPADTPKSPAVDRPASPQPPCTDEKPSTPKLCGTQLRDKDGKPILACFFCRGRKIACRPPPNGSTDPTCNQCERRGQKCFYPTENRRGQRKNKLVTHDDASPRVSSSRKAKEIRVGRPALLGEPGSSEVDI